jgi:7-cyano-7-deazaguanine reductase
VTQFDHRPEQSELGKKSSYTDTYDRSKLFPIPRQPKRDELGISSTLPFYGHDLWNHYEVSWLNEKGKPIVALAKIIYHCDSEFIIESKSMKLYFNSFNNTKFKTVTDVEQTVQKDIQAYTKASLLTVEIIPLSDIKNIDLHQRMAGICIDDLDIECTTYHNDSSLLHTENELIEEVLCSDLLKSNCLVTNQPDWCSIQIAYQGKKINHAGLLRYLVSFRNDNEFHEQCIEKIFIHILKQCQPEKLTIYGRSTRRGGLDINSYRSTHPIEQNAMINIRLCRQ